MNMLTGKVAFKLIILCQVLVSIQIMKGGTIVFKEYGNYLVYDDGRVYSKFRNRFLKTYDRNGYRIYYLKINNIQEYKLAHRLVAELFLPNPNNLPQVNHIDGNKANNHVSNLEWCTAYYNNKHARDNGLNNVSKSNSDRWKDEKFKETTSKNISKTRKQLGLAKGKNNPRFRYIILHNGIEISRDKLASICKRSMSNIDVKIKKCALGEYIEDFSKNNIKIIDTKKGQQTIETILWDEAHKNNGVE
nr:MAG TPA: homing endonuclease [Caudoviricetes sp.]